MIGGPNLRYVRVVPALAQCTGTTAVTLSTILLSSGVHDQSGLRLMVPRRVSRAITP